MWWVSRHPPFPLSQAQVQVADHLNSLFAHLSRKDAASSWRLRIQEKLPFRNSPQSAYLYGGVGSGKTELMSWFYESLSIREKKKIHFNEFMLQIHRGLFQREFNLSDCVRKSFASLKLLCVDEFQVVDIADAMLLRQLLLALAKERVSLFLTSNRSPETLYENGIQRESFIPCIRYIQKHFQVLCLNEDADYRSCSQLGWQSGGYFCDEAKSHRLLSSLQSSSFAKFRFKDFFTSPVGPIELQMLVEAHSVVLFFDVSPLSTIQSLDFLRRFILFVDFAYQRRVRNSDRTT